MEDLKIELTKLSVSLLLGSLLGLEREYQNKAAGFRTIALICMGSTVFTLISMRISISNPDRIAANIITGIGFIGAGVIFKNGANVYGLTTAATIWVSAAIGMAVGVGDYILATIITFITLMILSVFEYLQFTIDSAIENELLKCHLKYRKLKEKRSQNETTCEYEVFGRQKYLDIFNEFLLETTEVTTFEY